MNVKDIAIDAADRIAEIADDIATNLDGEDMTDATQDPKASKGKHLIDDRPDLFGVDDKGQPDKSKPKLDHTELADAQAVADATGGAVEHIGVAFHVALA